MGLFSGLKNAAGKLDWNKIGQAAGNARGMLSDDEEERQRALRAMMLQRQQAQPTPQQPMNSFNGAVAQQPSPEELAHAIEMMRQGRSQGWDGRWNPPNVLSFRGGY